MRVFYRKALAGYLLMSLWSLQTILATDQLTELEPGTDPVAERGSGALVFSYSAPLTTEDFLDAVAQESRLETIRSERLNDIYWDKKSRRLWATSDNGSNIAWSQATKYCKELKLGDFSDWRLPLIEELKGLHDVTSNQTFKVPKEIKLSACCQWSATKKSDTSAWNFSFRFRKPFSGSLTYSLDLRALCVRGPIAELPVDWPQNPK